MSTQHIKPEIRVKRVYHFAVIPVFFVLCLHLGAATLYVATNGPNTLPYDTWEKAASNIQWAVNAGTNGDTVWISNGVYVLTNQITVMSNITISGIGTGDKPVVNGNNSNRCFYFNSGVTGALKNLFVTGGYTNGSGGGVVFYSGIVSNCVFSNNVCTNYGGGMQLLAGVSTIKDCIFVDNKAYNGGGMDCSVVNNQTTVVDHCRFLTNTAIYGGGLYAGNSWAKNLGLTVTGCDFICNVVTGYSSQYGAKGGGAYVAFAPASALYTEGVLVKITHSTFSSNVSVGRGGGMVLYYSAVLSNSFISDNIAFTNGGGIFANGTPVITKCTIARNISANEGSGIYAMYAPVIQDSIIEGNGPGNGIYNQNESGVMIVKNCLIRNNYGAYGGGIRISVSNAISSCTIVSNYASSQGGGIYINSSGAQVENCIVYYNTCGTAAYSNWYNVNVNASYSNCCIAPALTGCITNNNITADPMCFDRAGGNYRLKTRSPCVNTGTNQNWMTNAVDLDGRIRIRYGRVDMGAYEAFNEGTLYKFH